MDLADSDKHMFERLLGELVVVGGGGGNDDDGDN